MQGRASLPAIENNALSGATTEDRPYMDFNAESLFSINPRAGFEAPLIRLLI